jgi:hypothetical protein
MQKPHEVTIIVNTRPKVVEKDDYSFEEILALAFDPVPSGDQVEFTVAYRRGHGNEREGTLTAGETVKIKNGMIFDVSATDKS